MELREAIEKRRSIRKFVDKDVSNETIEDIIDCGRLAPSAKNRQPWKFVVLKNDNKDRIVDIMLKHEEENPRDNATASFTAGVMKEASVLILVLKETNNNMHDFEMDTLSIGGAVENMLLRATDLGLGALWIGDTSHAKKDILEFIGHEEMDLSCAISIGYPNQEPHQRPRKELNEIIEWE